MRCTASLAESLFGDFAMLFPHLLLAPMMTEAIGER